jgi:hypothetical protein
MKSEKRTQGRPNSFLDNLTGKGDVWIEERKMVEDFPNLSDRLEYIDAMLQRLGY